MTERSWPRSSECDLPPPKTIRAVEARYAGLGHADDYWAKHVESESPPISVCKYQACLIFTVLRQAASDGNPATANKKNLMLFQCKTRCKPGEPADDIFLLKSCLTSDTRMSI